MQIRCLTPEDLDQILVIELSSPSPWLHSSLVSELQRPHGVHYVVTASGGKDVIAWCAALVLGSEAELLKVAVHDDHRKEGVAYFCLTELFNRLCKSNVQDVLLEVRSQNIPACQLYHKMGFQYVGIRPRYYQDPEDDALIFSKHIAYNSP